MMDSQPKTTHCYTSENFLRSMIILYKTTYCYTFENFLRSMIILYKQLFRPSFYSVKSFWRADVMKTCIQFSKTNFYFKFTWSLTLWFYTFKFSNNTFHFCACQLKTRRSSIVNINPFKTFRWRHFFPHSCSRFPMIEHMITAKNFRMSFSKTMQNIRNFSENKHFKFLWFKYPCSKRQWSWY